VKKLVNLTAEQVKLFEDKNFAFVATLNKDGSPQVTATWADTDGKNILVNIATSRQKFRNIIRDPRVAVALVDMKDPYKEIIIRGKVISIEKGKIADDHIDKMSKKYTGQDKYGSRRPGEQRVLLKIEPSKIVMW
jgi:PPOX class probable F420-dependent enzyme